MLEKDKRAKLRQLGSTLGPDLLKETIALFDEEQRALTKLQPASLVDASYGEHERQVLDVYQPKDTKELAPVVLFVHGGGFLKGDKGSDENWHNASVGRVAAQSGYVGVVMNYRLAPDFKWPSGGDDIASALQWIKDNIRNHGGNPENIYVMGTSAGAVHAATYLKMYDHTNVIKGAILLSGLYGFTPLDERDTFYYEDQSLYAERMPKEAVIETKLPLFFSCAELDPPRFQSEFLGLVKARFEKHESLSRSTIVTGHNHYSLAVHLGSNDSRLWNEVCAFINDTSVT